MDDPSALSVPMPLPEGRFDGREAFDRLLRIALASAARQGWREMVFSDPDFADWPLGERACIEALQAWSSSGRRLMLLAERFDCIERWHARFVGWRRTWDHIVECRAVRAPHAQRSGRSVPSALWTPGWIVHRIDAEHSRGVSSTDARTRSELRETIDACWRTGRPAFPATTAGL